MPGNASRRVFSRVSALSVGGSADAVRWRVGVELDSLSLIERSSKRMSDFGRICGVLAQALHQIYVSEGG
jgi:hypothetical protein